MRPSTASMAWGTRLITLSDRRPLPPSLSVTKQEHKSSARWLATLPPGAGHPNATALRAWRPLTTALRTKVRYNDSVTGRLSSPNYHRRCALQATASPKTTLS